jgi:hypothetical protein
MSGHGTRRCIGLSVRHEVVAQFEHEVVAQFERGSFNRDLAPLRCPLWTELVCKALLLLLDPISVRLPKTLNGRIERQDTQQEHRLVERWQEADCAPTHSDIQNVETYCKSHAATQCALIGKALLSADELTSTKLIHSSLHLGPAAPFTEQVLFKHNHDNSDADKRAHRK